MDPDGDGWVRFTSERTSPDAPAPACFRARYRPVAEAIEPEPGSLEHWLAERYCLYTLDDESRPQRGEIHHPPWPLQPAEAEIETNTMATEIGLDLEGEPLLHYARRQDVVFWAIEAADQSGM